MTDHTPAVDVSTSREHKAADAKLIAAAPTTLAALVTLCHRAHAAVALFDGLAECDDFTDALAAATVAARDAGADI